jgi:hypothetical protein
MIVKMESKPSKKTCKNRELNKIFLLLKQCSAKRKKQEFHQGKFKILVTLLL